MLRIDVLLNQLTDLQCFASARATKTTTYSSLLVAWESLPGPVKLSAPVCVHMFAMYIDHALNNLKNDAPLITLSADTKDL